MVNKSLAYNYDGVSTIADHVSFIVGCHKCVINFHCAVFHDGETKVVVLDIVTCRFLLVTLMTVLVFFDMGSAQAVVVFLMKNRKCANGC